jgi:TIR domain
VKVFISYKREDEQLAGAVNSGLKSLGHEPFYDQSLGIGQWEEGLTQQIEDCDVFVLLLSKLAAESDRVFEEVVHADALWKAAKRPIVLPVYIDKPEPADRRLNKILDRFERIDWRVDEGTENLVSKIGVMLAEPERLRQETISNNRRRKRWRRALIAAGLTVILAIVLVWLAHASSLTQIAALQTDNSDPAAAAAAFRRLRTLSYLVIPQLWLRGDRKPESLAERYFQVRGQRFDAEAKPLLQSSEREQFDRGLLLAALAALMRGSDPPPEVLKNYERENYDKLLVTLRGNEELQGIALAAWIDSRHLRIADGRRIWTCELPIEAGRCSLFPSLSTHVIVTSSAFKSDDEALFVSYGGQATGFDLNGSRGEVTTRSGHVKSVAADAGDVVFGFEVSRPDEASVVVDLKDGASPSISGGSAHSVAFGPCGECVSVLGKDRSVKVWHMGRGTVVPLSVVQPVQAIASGRTAGRLALIDGRDQLLLYGPDLAPLPAGPASFLRTGGIALSAGGRWIAVVHASTVTIIGSDGSTWTLVSDVLTPRPVAAAFAGNDLIVTRTAAGVRIWRIGSAKRSPLTPYERWLEWRKQLGVAAKDDDREARFGWDPAARDVRSYR